MTIKNRIGVIGGTFDPIHNGHLYIAENARVLLGLNEVIFMPSANPPHKRNKHISPAQTRLEMCSLAIEHNSYFKVSDLEIKRQGLSYTYDTLNELKEHYGLHSEIYFICGADMLADMPKWYRAEELLKTNKIIALSRPGFSIECIAIQSPLLKEYKNNITLLNILAVQISSTMIRNSIKQEHSVKYILPHKVNDYIRDNKLYH